MTKETKKKDPMYTQEMQRSLRMVERVVNQNAYDDILMDFKFWEGGMGQSGGYCW